MPRILRVFSLTLALYAAGLVAIVLGTASLVSLGAAGFASPFLAVSLAVLIVAAPLVAGHLVPGAPKRFVPMCPHCGSSLAKPVIDPLMFW